MAICGLRADSFPSYLPGGGVLRPLLSLLETAEEGIPEEEAKAEWSDIVNASKNAGYLAVHENRVLLQPEGKRLLASLRSLFSDALPPP
jgi:hypothetical protein